MSENVQSTLMNIKHWRKQQQLTLAAMAERLEISEAAMCRYENGSRRPDWPILERLVILTEGAVQPNDFFKGKAA